MTLLEPTTAEQPARSPRLRMTEDEFVEWEKRRDGRFEWVDGEVIELSAESLRHWDISIWWVKLLDLFVQRRRLGRVYGTNIATKTRKRSRRLPDVLVVLSDRQHLLEKALVSVPPDLIVEVVSPDDPSRDYRTKFLEYEAAGVREYWIIDPITENAYAYTLRDGKYVEIDPRDGWTESALFPGLKVRAEWFWQEELPDPIDTARALGIEV